MNGIVVNKAAKYYYGYTLSMASNGQLPLAYLASGRYYYGKSRPVRVVIRKAKTLDLTN